MREIGILMRPEMARASNKDLKVETRRMVGLEMVNEYPNEVDLAGVFRRDGSIYATFDTARMSGKKFGRLCDKYDYKPFTIKCPYGDIDDLLWIRENWNKDGHGGHRYVSDFPDHASLFWKPSIHMHKIIARTWCQIIDVRVERLHDITRDGAKDEGIDIFFERPCYRIPTKYKGVLITTTDPVTAYLSYVNAINDLTMNDNPWVWVVKYQVISTTGRPSTSQFHEDYMTKEVING